MLRKNVRSNVLSAIRCFFRYFTQCLFFQRLFFHRLKRAAKIAFIGLFTASSLHAKTKLPPAPFPTEPNQWIWDFATGENPRLAISTYRDSKDGDIFIADYYEKLEKMVGTWAIKGGWNYIPFPILATYSNPSFSFKKSPLCNGLSVETPWGGLEQSLKCNDANF